MTSTRFFFIKGLHDQLQNAGRTVVENELRLFRLNERIDNSDSRQADINFWQKKADASRKEFHALKKAFDEL